MIHPRTPYAVLKQTCLVLVLTISTLAPVYAQGEAHRRGTRQPHSTPRQSVPSYPAPLTQNLPELPAGFTQEVPGSVAELAEMENWVRNVVDQIRPTVVGIETQDGGLGSGVIISADGYVLTVAHVIRESNQKVTITLADGRELRGTTLGVIERTDAGILKIDNVRDLPFARIAPAETMTSGNWCLAMGHPGGFTSGREPVIRLGRVVALDQSVNVTNHHYPRPGLIQTDCVIINGDSGGPLFDMYGRVVGLHSCFSFGENSGNYHVRIGEYLENWEALTLSR